MQEKLIDIKFPSKKFNKKLASHDKDSFSAGNLTGAGKSKEVHKQIKHEDVKNLQHHHDVYLSIGKVEEKFTNKIVGSNIEGYIQYYSIQPFIVGLWTEVDVEYFHQHAKDVVSMLDATGSIASKVNGKMVLCYTILSADTIKKLKPLPLMEILTNSYDENPLNDV